MQSLALSVLGLALLLAATNMEMGNLREITLAEKGSMCAIGKALYQYDFDVFLPHCEAFALL